MSVRIPALVNALVEIDRSEAIQRAPYVGDSATHE